MFKQFVVALITVVIYDRVKTKVNRLYRWSCPTCGYKIVHTNHGEGIDRAVDHSREHN